MIMPYRSNCLKLNLRYAFLICLCGTLIFCQNVCAEETVRIKILAVNPSSTQELKTTVAQYLPQEVAPDDILDKEGLEIVYDSEKKAYFIKKEVELQPQETQTIEIRIRNVWTISSEQLEDVRSQLRQSLTSLKNTKFAATGQLLYDKAEDVLAQIEQNQERPLGVMQRVELFRTHVRQLEDLKQNALSLEAMRRMEGEAKAGIRQVKFKISAENPANEQRSLRVRSLLPRDIHERDVLDKGDFEIIFDQEQRVYALQMTDTLAPKEVRQYEIALRDVWHIPQVELDYLAEETQKLVALFAKSPYESFARKNGESIAQSLIAISALQNEVDSSGEIEDRMRAYVLNQQREKFSKRKFKELQDMLTEIPLMPQEHQKPLIERMIKKLIDAKDRVLAAMGHQPQKSIFWWFFLGVVLFLAVVTIIFYGVWLRRLQDNKWALPPKKKSAAPNSDKPKNEAPPV